MGEDYKAFVERINSMQSGEIIDKGNNLDSIFYLKMSCDCNKVATRLEIESEDGTPFGKKVLVLYKV